MIWILILLEIAILAWMAWYSNDATGESAMSWTMVILFVFALSVVIDIVYVMVVVVMHHVHHVH